MTAPRIPLTRPWMADEEFQALTDIARSGWLGQGTAVTEFERAVARLLGAKHAVACSSCTAALHMGLVACGIGPGDEVILPSYTWIATANAVRMVGATPMFVDIELSTFNATPEAVEAALSPRTKAIMPVDQFGFPVEIDPLMALAKRHGLAVIEDAACALGSRYHGRPVGSTAHASCFSFHPRKLITTGEGGMFVTNDDRLAEQARALLNHGAVRSDLAKHAADTVEALLAEQFPGVGYNYRMTNLQGALGVVQMGRLEAILQARRARAFRYAAAFSLLPEVALPAIPEGIDPNWQSYPIRIRASCPVERNQVAQRLLDAGIACRPAYMACHVQPAYRAFAPRALPNTEEALRSVILLPLYPQMTDAEQDDVIQTVTAAVRAREGVPASRV